MGQFQIPFGLALGRFANFYARTNNVLAENDATPDVTNGCLFFSNNTTNTTITHFDLTPMFGGTGGTYYQQFEGKRITVIFLDDSTRLANAARLFLATSEGLQGANNSIDLLYHNSAWLELSRSYNQSNVLSVDSVNLQTASSIFPNTDTGNIVVRGRGQSVIVNLLHGSTGGWSVRRFIGADPGTLLTLICAGDSQSLCICNSAAADTLVVSSSASSTQFRLATSAAITFVKGINKWHEIGNVWVATSGTIAT